MPPPPPTNTGAGPQPGLPPPPPMAGAPPHAEQPDAKRQRTGDEAGGAAARTARALVPADAFLSAEGNDRAISLTVQVRGRPRASAAARAALTRQPTARA